MTSSDPNPPNIENIRKRAKSLLKALKAGNPDAIARISQHHPRAGKAQMRLADAQLVLAKELGYSSWPKLKEDAERNTNDKVTQDGNETMTNVSSTELANSHMGDAPFDLKKVHQWLSRRLDNLAWDLSDERIAAKDVDLMINAAHAQQFHLMQGGGSRVGQQQGECLLSRVYLVAGDKELAIRHAERCLALSRENGELQRPFDRANAHGCAANAYAAAGRRDEASEQNQLAVDAASQVEGVEEKWHIARLYCASEKKEK